MSTPASIAILALMIITSTSLLLTTHWRWCIGALAIQYIGVLILVSQELPLGLAIIKLIAGWMSAAVLGLSQMELKETAGPTERRASSGRVFKLLAACMVLLIALSLSSTVSLWLPGLPTYSIQAGLVLIGIALLMLGMTSQPFQVAIGLLTLLSGFETLYAGVAPSILVAGLLAAINLGISLAGSYLILLTAPGETS